MFALVLGLLLLSPADSTVALSECDSLMTEADRRFDDWVDLQERWYDDDPDVRQTMNATIALYHRVRRCYGDRNRATVGETYFDEAFLHAALRQFSRAFDTFDAFFERFQIESQASLSAFPPDLVSNASRMYWARAFLHYRLGNLSGAFGDYTRAIAVTPDSLSYRKGVLTRDLGLMHQVTGDYTTAQSYYRRAERILAEADTSDPDIREMHARVLTTQADLLIEQAESQSYATSSFRNALAVLRKSEDVYPRRDTKQAARRMNLTAIVLGYLDAPDDAVPLQSSALRIARRTGDIRLQAVLLLNRAYVRMLDGRWAPAVEDLRAALPMVRDIRDLVLQRRITHHLALIEEIRQNWSAAERYYRNGIDVAEKQRASISATQWSLTAFGQWQAVHRGLVRVLIAQDRPTEAFRVLEQTRARHLTDLRVQGKLSRDLPATKRVRFDSLANALVAVRTRLAKESLDVEDRARLRAKESELMADRRSLLNVTTSAQRPALSSLQDVLRRENRTLVSYFLDDPNPHLDRAPRSHAFVVTPDTLRAVSLPDVSHESVHTTLHRISPLFAASSSKPSVSLNAAHFDLHRLHELYGSVLAPVESALAPSDRPLIVVPDGPLFQIPFSMLVTSEPPNRFAYQTAEFLLHERPTTVELASTLVTLPSTSAGMDTLSFEAEIAAYGVSRFDSLRTLPSSLRSHLPASYADSSRIHLPELPGVAQELTMIGNLFDRSRVALDHQATEASFRRAASDTHILHLASHAFAHPSSPLYNAFLLRRDRRRSEQDGVLFLHELRADARPIPLVVLSGCSTARGTLWSGEGMQGLQYAFRAMGAQSTLSNLWPAPDEASVALTESFYRHLRTGAGKDVALQRAQIAFMQNHPHQQSPFFWAFPVLYGAPEPLPAVSDARPWWLYSLVVLILAGGALTGYRHRFALFARGTRLSNRFS